MRRGSVERAGGPRRRPHLQLPASTCPPPTHTHTHVPPPLPQTYRHSQVHNAAVHQQRRQVGRPPPARPAAAARHGGRPRGARGSAHGRDVHEGVGDPQFARGERGGARGCGGGGGGRGGGRGRRLLRLGWGKPQCRLLPPPPRPRHGTHASWGCNACTWPGVSPQESAEPGAPPHSTLTDTARRGRRGRRGWPRARGATPGGERQGGHLQCARVKGVCNQTRSARDDGRDRKTRPKSERTNALALAFSVRCERIALLFENARQPQAPISHPPGAEAFSSPSPGLSFVCTTHTTCDAAETHPTHRRGSTHPALPTLRPGRRRRCERPPARRRGRRRQAGGAGGGGWRRAPRVCGAGQWRGRRHRARGRGAG